MTQRRDFKKRVRDRQAATGENYTTARARVLAPHTRPSAVPVVEMIDASEQAELLGLHCPVVICKALIEQVALSRVLGCVRDALSASEGDAAAESMRAVVLRGERPARTRRVGGDTVVYELRRFYARARAGLGGFDAWGLRLALHIDGETVVCGLSSRARPAKPLAVRDREVVLMIELAGEALQNLPI